VSEKPVKQYLPKFGLGIDCETSGSIFGGKSASEYQAVSFGLVVFDFKTFEPVDAMYVEIKFDATKWKWSDEAQKIHGLSREYLEANGVTQEEAACLIAEFILKWFAPDSNIFLLGHNVQFDVDFIEQLMVPFGLMFGLSPTRIDTGGVGYVMLGYHKSDLLFDAVGLDKRGAHNALEDILLTLETAKRLRMLANTALEG